MKKTIFERSQESEKHISEFLKEEGENVWSMVAEEILKTEELMREIHNLDCELIGRLKENQAAVARLIGIRERLEEEINESNI